MKIVAGLKNRLWLLAALPAVTLLTCTPPPAVTPTPMPTPAAQAPAIPTAPPALTPPLIPASTPTPAPARPTTAPAEISSADDAIGRFAIRVDNLPRELTAPRPQYDTADAFAALVKPHFLAGGVDGELRPAAGRPTAIVEREGRLRVELTGESGLSYLDLLALHSELLGEHPVHKVYRLLAMGIPMSPDLRRKLAAGPADELFANIEFEYLRGQETAGVVAEVFPDGTFLVIPFALPAEWQSRDADIAAPTHLHLNPRALNAGVSDLAKDYEREILALPFPEQRYPAAALARKRCGVYRESLAAPAYAALLAAVGYRFSPEHIAGESSNPAAPFGERMAALLWGGFGADRQYFGFEGAWIAAVLRQGGADWLGDCDTAGGVRSYRVVGESAARYYLTVRRSLEPDQKQRYKILTLDRDGAAAEIYTAPGILLMAFPLPPDGRNWLLSAEGWPEAAAGQPADPRWQAVYSVALADPQQYRIVGYPLSRHSDDPPAGLYGVSPRLSGDGKYLFNTLYGFREEGGGIWVVDLSARDFADNPANFARLVAWDHTLSWTLLPNPATPSSPYLHLFMTGKEVADDFAMTANILRVRDDGLASAIEREERLLQMVGWNPVPFGWQRLSDTQYRVLVETHYNYESSLLPRAKGVYIIPVDLSADGE